MCLFLLHYGPEGFPSPLAHKARNNYNKLTFSTTNIVNERKSFFH